MTTPPAIGGGGKIRMTRNQRFLGFAVTGGLAFYAVWGLVTYVHFLMVGPALPERSRLTERKGRLVFAKRDGGKTKRQNLLLRIEGDAETFLFSPRAGEVDPVEEALTETEGEVALLYHPASMDVYELRRGKRTISAYEETLAHYGESAASRSHLRGVLAAALLCFAVFVGLGLLRVPVVTARGKGAAG